MKTNIFELPEYSLAFVKFVRQGVEKLMDAKDNLWARMPKSPPVPSLPVSQNTLPTGHVVQHEPFVVSARYETTFQDVMAFDIDSLICQIDGLAEQTLSVVMPRLFEAVGKTSDAVGNSVDARGKHFSFDIFFECMEKLEMSFDREGNPERPVFVVNPKMAEYISSLPPITEEQQKKLDDLIQRKRTEFNARKRDRKLR